MSDTTAALRRKIGSARDLQSVVRTMKALAASSIGQYEASVRALADYHRAVRLGLGVCLRQSGAESGDGFETGSELIGAIVFGSDQGLVGSFNDVVVEHAIPALAALPSPPAVWAVGERVHERLVDFGITPRGYFAVPGSVQAIAPMIGRMVMETASHAWLAELHLFYNRPTSDASYEPAGQRLLPLDDAWRREHAATGWPSTALPEVLGDRRVAFRALVREYVFVSLFRACAESLASENASRLAAMQRAETNIRELLEELEKTHARSRQDSIDAELFDLIAGFEALSRELTRPRRPPSTSPAAPHRSPASR